jgi:phenylpropionate dioxygenase-like ring-hydroxylating dioxygenase large terminal subunit
MTPSSQLPVAATDPVQAYLDLGLRNYWHPVVASWRVASTPIGITRLGDQIALWRDQQGLVHAVEDRCPHRGARLSLGANLGENLACWYHGVEVDGTGTVQKVPAVPGCLLDGRKRVKSYPVKECFDAIFLWFGDEAHPEPAPLALPEELADQQSYSSFLCTAQWKCGHQSAADNLFDPMHGAYLHAVSHSLDEGGKQAEMRVRKTDIGLVIEKTEQRGINFDWTEFGETGCLWMRLEVPYKAKYGGGLFGIVAFATPIDATHCQVFFWRTRKARGWQRDLWRFMFRNRLEALHYAVIEQDRRVLENMAPNATSHEFLYQHDLGVARLRQLLRQRAKEEMTALAAYRAGKNLAESAAASS